MKLTEVSYPSGSINFNFPQLRQSNLRQIGTSIGVQV